MNYFTSLYRPMPQLNPASTPLAGTELMRVYQDGEERQTPVTAVTAGSQPLDNTLTAISALTGTGIIVRTGNGDTDAATRTVTASTGITVSNGSGVAGNPTVSITNTGVSAATYGSATKSAQIALNAQGQATSASEVTITPAVGSITGLGTGIATALAVNVGTAGAPVVNGGALGTPASGTLTNCTGLPTSGVVYQDIVVTAYTTGSGTHTTAAGAKWSWVRLVGGGGGGQGSGTGPGAGGDGGDTTFGALTAGGGDGGGASGNIGGAGGTGSGGDVNLEGTRGMSASTGYTFQDGGLGGGTTMGCATPSPASGPGQSPPPNTGVGGSGGSADATASPGGGGGGGAYVEKLINSPAASYSYAVGAGGTAGTIGTGTNPRAGIAGAAGLIIVMEGFL